MLEYLYARFRAKGKKQSELNRARNLGFFPCQLEHVRALVFGLEVGDDVRASRGRERKTKIEEDVGCTRKREAALPRSRARAGLRLA
jgi:hypothetical protein